MEVAKMKGKIVEHIIDFNNREVNPCHTPKM